MSLKMEYHLKLNFTPNGISLTMKKSLKVECQSKWNVTQNEMSLKMDVTQNGMSLKMKSH